MHALVYHQAFNVCKYDILPLSLLFSYSMSLSLSHFLCVSVSHHSSSTRDLIPKAVQVVALKDAHSDVNKHALYML